MGVLAFDWTFGGVIPGWVLVLLGGLALWWGGDQLVEGAAAISRRLRIPEHVIGAVVLGFGTSFPELLVCLDAALTGTPEFVSGNLFGSNSANVGLILGVAAVLSPVLVERKLRRVDLPLGLLTGVALWTWLTFAEPAIGRGVSLALLAGFVLYITVSLRTARRGRPEPLEETGAGGSLAAQLGVLVLGLLLVALGAQWFVLGAERIAEDFGVPHEVVGLTVLALGTSLPELVTTVAAARQGHPELAIGNVAGSNVFNLLFVLGTTGALSTIPISDDMRIDILVMSGFAVLAFPFFWKGHRLGRTQGVLLLLCYCGYIAWMFLSGRV